MKIYTRVVFDMASGRVEEADYYEYDGLVDECKGKGGSAPAAPDYSPIMKADLDFRMKQYEESKPMVQKLVDQSSAASDMNMQMAKENQAREAEQYKRYQAIYQPTQQQTAADAYGQQYLSADEKAQLMEAVSPDSGLTEDERTQRLSAFSSLAEERAATEAQGTANTALNRAVTQQGRMLGRYGGDPARMAAIAKQLTNQQALTAVNAGNMARQNVRDRGVAMRANLLGMGQTNVGNAVNLGGLASNQAGASVSNAAAGSTAGMANAQYVSQGYGNQMNMMNQGYQNQMQQWKANQSAGDMSGIGALVGGVAGSFLGPMGTAAGSALGSYMMSADGGMVEGPGTGTSDDVEAVNKDTGQRYRLSNGEYILPADTTRRIGRAALDRLVQNTHTPVRRSRALAGG